jgi:CRISPR-associated protein Cas1
MIRHITLSQPGYFLGLHGERLQVLEKESLVQEYPLSRLKSIRVADRGISFSSNLVAACSRRGIALFLYDYSGKPIVSVSGMHQHGVVEMRKRQLQFVESDAAPNAARTIILGKIRNQRAVILYFAKYLKKRDGEIPASLLKAAESIQKNYSNLKNMEFQGNWRETLLGYEGASAAVYWEAWKDPSLIGNEFRGRTGRGAGDPYNQALNLGYAILSSYIWNAIVIAGLEPYAGMLHTDRPGKPSLVLDIMEEYRPWCVERPVLRLKTHLHNTESLTPQAKKLVIAGVHESFESDYPYRNKRVRLEVILQRQIYRLAGTFYGKKIYKPYLFKW